MSKLLRSMVPAIALLVSGCGFARDEQVIGPYRLVAVDVPSETALCISVERGNGDCSGDGLPEPVVFAAGGDERYVVLARHPNGLKLETEYYYLIRKPDEKRGLPKQSVVGPMDEATFDRERRRLHLPGFTHVIDGLK